MRWKEVKEVSAGGKIIQEALLGTLLRSLPKYMETRRSLDAFTRKLKVHMSEQDIFMVAYTCLMSINYFITLNFISYYIVLRGYENINFQLIKIFYYIILCELYRDFSTR